MGAKQIIQAFVPIAFAAGAACKSDQPAQAKPDPTAAKPAETAPAAPTLVPLAEGTPAPDFSLTDQNGQQVSLAALRGKPVVVYFYPADFGPNCSAEAVQFAGAMEQFKSLGATVIGISRNDQVSHKDFAEKKQLPFSLLSDPNGELAAKYGVGIQPNGKLWRVTFVIDSQGVIKKVFSGEGFVKNVVGHSDNVLAVMKTL